MQKKKENIKRKLKNFKISSYKICNQMKGDEKKYIYYLDMVQISNIS